MKPSRPSRRLARIAAAIGLALCLAACHQITMARLYFANYGTDMQLKQVLPLTLPFREDNGWVIVLARVNCAPADFVLDTGAFMLPSSPAAGPSPWA